MKCDFFLKMRLVHFQGQCIEYDRSVNTGEKKPVVENCSAHIFIFFDVNEQENDTRIFPRLKLHNPYNTGTTTKKIVAAFSHFLKCKCNNKSEQTAVAQLLLHNVTCCQHCLFFNKMPEMLV